MQTHFNTNLQLCAGFIYAWLRWKKTELQKHDNKLSMLFHCCEIDSQLSEWGYPQCILTPIANVLALRYELFFQTETNNHLLLKQTQIFQFNIRMAISWRLEHSWQPAEYLRCSILSGQCSWNVKSKYQNQHFCANLLFSEANMLY